MLMAGSDPSPIWDTMAARTLAKVTTAKFRAVLFETREPSFSAFSSTVSRAKNTPEIGALKPADIPAADPAAINAVKDCFGRKL